MDLSRLHTIILLGLSGEGLMICPFFAFGLSLGDRLAGLRFLCGRLLGIVGFGAIVITLGQAISIPESWIQLSFGLLVIAMGIRRIVLLRKGRSEHTGTCRKNGAEGQQAGFFLGLFRGLANPGRKYIYLAPLLIGVSWAQGLATSFLFGVSSSLYLVLGFASAALIGRLVPWKRQIGGIGAIVLVVIGCWYTYRGLINFHIA